MVAPFAPSSIDTHGIRAWALEHVNDRYAKRALQRLDILARDPRLRTDFQIETIGTENRLAPLVSSPAMRAIVGTPTIDMRKDVLDAGAVLLIDTSGRDQASEVAGDLLGKLVIRALLHAAKRRQSDSLALLFADECARYVSSDWERALAELRKYRVGFVSGHQTYAMLGKLDDPVRLAIERIPATKIVFRMNSMEEASTLAPEVMRLNLERPVEALIKPTVIGHKKVRLNNRSVGSSSAITDSTTDTFSQSVTVGVGTQQSKTRSRAETLSEAETHGTNWSHTHTEADTVGEADTVSETDSYSSGTSGSRGTSDERSTNSGSSLSYDRPGPLGVRGLPASGTAAARGELLSLGLLEVQRRAALMKEYVFPLWTWERHKSGFSESKLRPGIDGALAAKIGGTVSIIGTGAERAQLGTFPAPLRFLDDGNTLVRAKDLEDFVVSASELLDDMDVLLAELRKQAESSH